MVADRATVGVGAVIIVVVEELTPGPRVARVVGARIAVVAGDGGTLAFSRIAVVIAGAGVPIAAAVGVVRGIGALARIQVAGVIGAGIVVIAVLVGIAEAARQVEFA
jgi:hypothetical protein